MKVTIAIRIRLALAASIANLTIRAVVHTVAITFLAFWGQVRFIAIRAEVTGLSASRNGTTARARATRGARGRRLAVAPRNANACSCTLVRLVLAKLGTVDRISPPSTASIHIRRGPKITTGAPSVSRKRYYALIAVSTANAIRIAAVAPKRAARLLALTRGHTYNLSLTRSPRRTSRSGDAIAAFITDGRILTARRELTVCCAKI